MSRDSIPADDAGREQCNDPESQPIAIIGMACAFPEADDLAAFWQLQVEGVDATKVVPPDRFDIDRYYDARPQTPGRIVSRKGGFLRDVRGFDAHFFGISGREAAHMDPQQRLLLEAAATAVEDAGLRIQQLSGTMTSVVVGQTNSGYWDILRGAELLDIYANAGTARSILSGRLSYFFDLRGPSTSVDTACSSSLVAVHQACETLRSGEASLALAAGVNLVLTPDESITFSQADMLSSDGKCKFGAYNADGFVRSEGVGVVVLKPLSRAIADGDAIYAVIHGSAVESEGRSSGQLMSPSETGQIDTIRRACRRAGVEPGQIDYVEAHGTGTSTGDQVELRALDRVYGTGAGRTTDDPVLVGSVKTNIGHTEAAAGIAGLIKAALCLTHATVPLSLHSSRLTDNVDWAQMAVEIPQSSRGWDQNGTPRYAGVSSYGISGTNAHVVLGSHHHQHTTAEASQRAADEQQHYLFTISAQTPAALQALARSYESYLGADGDGRHHSMRDICYSAAARRSHHRHRLTIVAAGRDDVVAELGATSPSAEATIESATKTIFVFPGQGSQWVGMGRRLFESSKVFRDAITECDEHVRAEVGWSLIECLHDSDADAALPIDVVQPLLWAMEVGLAAYWRSLGVTPDVMIGHSMGEVAAATAAGALSLADGAAVICRRSRLLKDVAGEGSMAAIELPADHLRRELAEVPDVAVAASNSPRLSIISGKTQAVEQVVSGLVDRGIFAKSVKVDVASHSSQVDPLLETLREQLKSIQPGRGHVPIRSTVTGELSTGEEMDADYWVRNLREEVLLNAAVTTEIEAASGVTFIEVSPHPILTSAVKDSLPEGRSDALVVASLMRDNDDVASLLASVAQLHKAGYPVRLEALFEDPAHYVRLPEYPWQHTDFWPEQQANELTHARHPLLGAHAADEDGSHRWEGQIDLGRNAYLLEHQVQGLPILPGTAYVELALAAAAEAIGSDITLSGIRYEKALFFTAATPPRLRLTLLPAGPHRWTFEVSSADESGWTRHALGAMASASPGARILDSPDDPFVQIIDRIPERLTGAEFYGRFAARGNDWRGPFQGIRSLHRSETEVLSEVVAPLGLQAVGEHHAHPAVLDACGQALAATLPGSEIAGEQYAFVLGSIDEFRLHNPLVGTLFSHIVRIDLTAESFSGDITIRDDQGRLMAEFRGLRIRWLLRQEQSVQFEDWLYESHWTPVDVPASLTSREHDSWLVFEDDLVGPQVAPARGARIAVVPGDRYERLGVDRFRIDPARLEDYVRLLHDVGHDHPEGITAIVSLWSMRDHTVAANSLGLGSALLLCQALSTVAADYTGSRLFLVTRGAEAISEQDGPTSGEQAAVWGFGRTVAGELPDLHCTLVDLSAEHDIADIEALSLEVLTADPAEDQIALRSGRRHVLRLRRRGAEQAGEVTEIAPSDDSSIVPVQRTVPARTPGADEVEIAVSYAGVNFRDVLQSARAYPGSTEDSQLGWESSGVVTAVGAEVHGLDVGDRVVAFAHPGMSTQVIANRHLTARLPDTLSLAEAATIPAAYLTAWYGLIEFASLREGEKVLIHSATGGVGLAAVQIAQWRGAIVYATAGTESKRSLLRRMGVAHVGDSRADFAGPLLAATRGSGMDVILNSLTGEAIDQNLDLLAPYGRYVEISKQDLTDGRPIGLRGLLRNGSFLALDIADFWREHPERAGTMLQRIVRLIGAGELAPLPYQIYSRDDAGEAFADMLAARHIGKLVIEMDGASTRGGHPGTGVQSVQAEEFVPVRMKPDATYLVTGGAGGLGSVLARWLVDRGARHLVLTGRSLLSESSESGRSLASLVSELTSRGAEVQYAPVDAADEQSMRRLIQHRQDTGCPPVRGVFHTAGVFMYKAIGEVTLRDLDTVLRPKLAGGLVLDALFDDDSLDHFVLFSSGSSVLASPQLAAYAAANGSLNAIARARRHRGLSALSVNWGFWAETGMVAKAGEEIGRSLLPKGMTSFSPEEGLAVLDHLIGTGATETLVMPVNWPRWKAAYPAAAESPLLRELAGSDTPRHTADVQHLGQGPSKTPARRVEPALPRPPKPAEPRQQETAPARYVEPVPAVVQPPVPQDRSGDSRALLLAATAAILRISPDQLDLRRDLTSQGIDSLMAAQLRQEVQRECGTLLPISKILSRTPLGELAESLLPGA
ncbi:SDR family NAD(P)-dependent oxidoreductase [Streptomyces sp. NPDC094038]|uniref:type I polyketide synthase n=1 Tax=Streptomyces sp. NPDC094038 TaxID=3366055 RepID=UPI0037FCAF47